MPEWSVDNERSLGELEKALTLLETTTKVAEKWLDQMSHDFKPDDLDDALGLRLTKMMWQTTFVKHALTTTNPLEAFDHIAKFMVELGIPGLVVQTYDSENEMDEALMAAARVRYEKEQQQEGGGEG